MTSDNTQINQRIGQLIKRLRRQRGLTQTQLAQAMKTSQSAINQIERGRRNLSLATIHRFSQALRHPLFALDSPHIDLRIKGGHQLKGEVKLNKSKNSAVALMMAALLNRGTTLIRDVPRIEEALRLIETLDSLGVNCRWTNKRDLEIKRPARLKKSQLDTEAIKQTRAGLMMIGSLTGHDLPLQIPFSGGCRLGRRSIIAHRLGLFRLGIEIETTDEGYYSITGQLKAAKRPVVMYESGDTATINVVLAAAQIPKTTTIKLASANYQIQDVCYFLQQLGVQIDGIGTTTLQITGQSKPFNKDISYSPIEDPIEAMTFLAAAITTDSNLTLKRVPLDFLELEFCKLEEMGLKFEISNEFLADNNLSKLVDIKIRRHGGQLKALEDKISPRPFPGLNIDSLPYFVPIAATATGTTLIHDWIYENRAVYYVELKRIGAEVQLADPHRVYVTGPTNWRATELSCPPALRPATINLIGMMAAPGISTLRNIYTINRGYEAIVERLLDLGADIEILYDPLID